jgi:hypothetical protein
MSDRSLIENNAGFNDDYKLVIKRSDSGSSSLDGLFGYKASEVENTSKVEVVGSSDLTLAILDFENSLDNFGRDTSFKIKTKAVLTPKEINAFFDIVEKYSDRFQFGYIVEKHVCNLIKNSYDSGNNSFNFDYNFSTYSNYNFVHGLEGKHNDPIKISVVGNVPNYFATQAKNIRFDIECSVGWEAFWDTKNVDVKIKGNVGSAFGKRAENLNLILDGNLDTNSCNFSKNISMIINGDVGQDFARHSERIYAIINGNLNQRGSGYKTTNFECFVKGNDDNNYFYCDGFFHTKDDVRTFRTYKKIMKEVNLRFEEK